MSISLKLALTALLVLANAFFVAVEFAFVSVRRSRIEVLAAGGRGNAAALIRALDHLDEMISATQFGITSASLALGWIGEDAIAGLVGPLLNNVLPPSLAFAASHGAASLIALAVVTYLHLVVGEYVPKALSIEYAEAIGLGVARFMSAFYLVFKPFIWVINQSGKAILSLIGLNNANSHQAAYSGEELRHLINVSHESGTIEADEKKLIHNVFEFSDLTAEDVIIPRTKVVAVEEKASLIEVAKVFHESGYSRLPVYRESFDEIIGILHHKDVMQALIEGSLPELGSLVHPATFIPSSARLVDVLQKMQKGHLHLAIIVDEHGGFEGLVTLEDLLEEIVGEIEDEHDEISPEPYRERTDGSFVMDGGIPVRDVNRRFDIGLPESDDYNTLAGFLIAREGRLLSEGDSINYNGVNFLVERIKQRRIERVRMQLREQAADTEPGFSRDESHSI